MGGKIIIFKKLFLPEIWLWLKEYTMRRGVLCTSGSRKSAEDLNYPHRHMPIVYTWWINTINTNNSRKVSFFSTHSALLSSPQKPTKSKYYSPALLPKSINLITHQLYRWNVNYLSILVLRSALIILLEMHYNTWKDGTMQYKRPHLKFRALSF